MIRRPLAIATALSLFLGGGALAHHGWGSYDAAKTVTVNSTVERLEWQNPHVHIGVKHEGGTWEAVLAPPFRMQARGLSPEMLKVGTAVAVEGYASTATQRELRAERISIGGRSFELR